MVNENIQRFNKGMKSVIIVIFKESTKGLLPHACPDSECFVMGMGGSSSLNVFCPPPRLFGEKGKDLVLGSPSVLQFPYRSRYLVDATHPTVVYRFFRNLNGVLFMV